MSALTEVLGGFDAIASDQEALYRRLHSAPELSMHEHATTTEIEKRLRATGFAVHRVGGGIVGVCENGDGPVVLARADIDALPVTELTGLPYASTVVATTRDGEQVGVMHACGHDVHIATLIGACMLLAGRRDTWSGTFIAVFQPAEENAEGALSMIDAGLVGLIPRPDVAFAQHVLGQEAGTILTAPGPVLAAADSVRITVHGTGSHGSMPQLGVDPVLLAAAIVQRLQGIVSREMAPGEPAVVTVGSLRAGSKSNIIPDSATLLLNTRCYSDTVRRTIIESIERIVRAECAASGSPREPEFEYYDRFPLTINDDDTTRTVTEAFRAHFGADQVLPLHPLSASEDFSRIPDAFGTPYTYWGIGGFAAGTTPPPNHSPKFAPVLQPTLATGTCALVVAALAYLGADER